MTKNIDQQPEKIDEILRKWLFVTKVRNEKNLPFQFLEGASIILQDQDISQSDLKTILPAQPILGTPPRDQLFQELLSKTEKAKTKLLEVTQTQKTTSLLPSLPPQPPPVSGTKNNTDSEQLIKESMKKEDDESDQESDDEKPDLPIKHPFEPFRSIEPIKDGTPQKVVKMTPIKQTTQQKSKAEDDDEKLSQVNISFGELIK